MKFLKRNWFGLLGITIGIASLTLSLYVYRISGIPPSPFFLVDPIRTDVIDSDRLSETPIRILKLNGEEIRGNVTSKRFYFWNDSRKPIKASNILEPLVVTLNNPNSEILDYAILKYSRQVVRPVLNRNLMNEKRSLSLSFDILEFQDGLTGQVIYTGDPNTDIIISGTIEGVHQIKTNVEAARSQFRKEMCYWSILLLVFWLSFVIRFIFDYRRLSKSNPHFDIRDKLGKMKRRILIVCIMGIFFLSMGYKTLTLARQKAVNSVIEVVPEVISP